MSLFGMMRTSVSGMAAQANRLAAISDNIANSSTNGYKRSSVEFSTYVLDNAAGSYTSGSVNTEIRNEISRQGPLRPTSSETDLAINGRGFFVVSDISGETFLSRAGSFIVDSDGKLVNTAGHYLMGYDTKNAPATIVANGFGGLEQINVGLLELQSTPSTSGSMTANMPANAAVTPAANLPSANAATATFSGKTSLVAFDNLGNERFIDIYFAKSGANQWEAVAYDGNTAAAGGSFPYSAGPISSATLEFDPANGLLTAASPKSLAVPVPGGQSMVVDLAATTQLGEEFTVLAASSNGNGPSSVERVEIGQKGEVVGIYQNGFRREIYQLVLADVPSPDNLRPLPGSVFAATLESGDVLVGYPGNGGLGSITTGALEESNVDLASELTEMIESQRSYTANSKVFQTGSDLMDVLVNLKR